MDANDLELKLARIRARDEVNELVEERSTALAAAEGSPVFKTARGDQPGEHKIRDEYRDRVRKELGL